jgi:hypothetical protein
MQRSRLRPARSRTAAQACRPPFGFGASKRKTWRRAPAGGVALKAASPSACARVRRARARFAASICRPAARQESNRADLAARQHLDALERLITEQAVERSQFKAILNEKDPPPCALAVDAPPSFRGRIISQRVHELRSHPDFRIARRALIISRLAQVISERKVQGGLRRVLLTQAKRLQWLSARRYEALGGAASVAAEAEGEEV